MNRGLVTFIRTMAARARHRRSNTVPMGSVGREGTTHAPARAAHGTGLKESEFTHAIQRTLRAADLAGVNGVPTAPSSLHCTVAPPFGGGAVGPLSPLEPMLAATFPDNSDRLGMAGPTGNVGRRNAA